MEIPEQLRSEFDKLNPEQRFAVETLNGPVLVIAGPGTGKTQLLSMRVMNILHHCDVSPENILCLTFTDAGAQAMTKRLVGFIGRAAYDVQISTFHSFASFLRNRYQELFQRGAYDRHISSLQAANLVNTLLQNLSIDDPLFCKPKDGLSGNMRDMVSFISTFKRSGLRPAEFKAIVQQNIEFFDFIEDDEELLALINSEIPRRKVEKLEFIDRFDAAMLRIEASVPGQLRQPVVSIPGTYSPYALFFFNEYRHICSLATGLDVRDRSSAYQQFRKRFFEVTDKSGKDKLLKERNVNRKLLSAIKIFEQYQTILDKQSLYDYDDMILDAILAIEQNPTLKYNLQDRYRYILVDEFQDTNGAQMRLLDLLTDYSPSPNILAVGDDDQAIMRFQGASIEYIEQFEKKYEDVTRVILKTNYRSLPSLLDLGRRVASQIDDRSTASAADKVLVAHRKEREPLSISAKVFPSREAEYHAIAADIKKRIEGGAISNSNNPDSAIAVIAAKHHMLAGMIPYLKAQGIAYNYRISDTVTKIESLQTLLALMRFCTAYGMQRIDEAEAYLPQILTADELGVETEKYFSFALNAKKQHRSWLVSLRTAADPRLKELGCWLVNVAKQSLTHPVREVIAELAEPIKRYHRDADKQDLLSSIEFNYGLKALLCFVEDELAANASFGQSDRPLRLSDVVSILDQAKRLDVNIEVDIPIKRPEAVNLTTAHGSKGLEYDIVYLLDADNESWHRSAANSLPLSQNMLFSTVKDKNDIRRLLFVAITRARDELEVSIGKGGLIGELLEELCVEEITPDDEQIAQQSEHCWMDNVRPDDAGLMDLLRPHIEGQKMSASLLNKFVEYNAGQSDRLVLLTKGLLGIPEQPSVSLEFGSIVHAFLQDYLNKVIKTGESTLEDLAAGYRQRITWLDFSEADIRQMHQRLDRIINGFLPAFSQSLTEAHLAEQWVESKLDDIPLSGKCDLLELDELDRTIKIYDYKTGILKKNNKPNRSQIRQLQFYKLLLENSSEYRDWHVSGGADIFVEPLKDNNNRLAEPQFLETPDSEMDRLCLLIKAVWHRMRNGLFDMSGFEVSEQLQTLRSATVYAARSDKADKQKNPSPDELQEAFEMWLIDEYLNHLEATE